MSEGFLVLRSMTITRLRIRIPKYDVCTILSMTNPGFLFTGNSKRIKTTSFTNVLRFLSFIFKLFTWFILFLIFIGFSYILSFRMFILNLRNLRKTNSVVYKAPFLYRLRNLVFEDFSGV